MRHCMGIGCTHGVSPCPAHVAWIGEGGGGRDDDGGERCPWEESPRGSSAAVGGDCGCFRADFDRLLFNPSTRRVGRRPLSSTAGVKRRIMPWDEQRLKDAEEKRRPLLSSGRRHLSLADHEA